MRYPQILPLVASVLFGGLALGCSSEGESQGQGDPLQAQEPADIVEAFYDAANRGNYEEAKQFFSQEGISNLEGPLGALAGGLKGIMDGYTRNGTLMGVEVGAVTVRGEGASCTVEKRFQDGSTEALPVEFINENGHWKIAWSTPTL